MNCKIAAKILLISLILTNFYGCGNSFNMTKPVNSNAPYYTISIYSYEKLRNEYIDIDIKMPIIINTSSNSNAFIETVNNQIERDVKEIIDNKKLTAKNEYETNMKSFIEEIRNKFREGFPASRSNVNNFPNRTPFSDESETISGFTNSNDLIIPGLHNKNIIVIETTTKDKNETTLNSETSNKRIAPSENGDSTNYSNRNNDSNPNSNFIKRGKRSSKSNTDRPSFPQQNNQMDDDQVQKKEANEYNEQSTIKSKSSSRFQEDLNIIKPSKKSSIVEEKDTSTNKNSPTPYSSTSVTSDYIITCLDNEYISINISINTYGTHTDVKNLFYNLDLKNEKILTLKDILGEEYKGELENTHFFINTNHVPVIINDDGSLTITSKTE